MTAGRFGTNVSAAPDNSTQAVNRLADDREALDSLRSLAPLHQRYAVRRGMRALGIEGDAPGLDDLALAVKVPRPPITDIGPCFEGDRLFAWAIQQYLGDPRFTDEDGEFDATRALKSARNIVGPEARARRLEENRQAWAGFRHAKAMHDRWHRLAKWLADFATTMAPWVPDSSLAAMPEPELRELAITTATRWSDDIRASRLVCLATDGTPYLAETGEVLDGPLPDLTPTERRLMCPLHWRRQLRRRAAHARQFWSAALQTVGGKAPYADDYTLGRWQERQDAARAFGEGREIVCGDTHVPLIDVMETSAAATLHRTYVMTVGMEDIAKRLGLIPVFITITLPPEWHANPSDGTCSWTPAHAPHKADRALADLWARFRTALSDQEIRMLGLRVFEGHEDACPHLHALLYVYPGAADMVDAVLRRIRPEPVRGKRIATKLVRIDQSRAKAASYCMKYIMKGLNVPPSDALKTHGLDNETRSAVADALLADIDEDEVELPTTRARSGDEDRQVEHYDRHRAMCSERSIRRFDLLGVHGIQRVWQRIFTMKDVPADAPARVQRAHAAMRARRWGAAILALGGVRGGQRGRLRLEYDERENGYGEMRRVPMRIRDTASEWSTPLKPKTWTIEETARRKDDDTIKKDAERRREELERDFARINVIVADAARVSTLAVSLPRAGADAPAMTAPVRAFIKKSPASEAPRAPPQGRAPPAAAGIRRRAMLTMGLEAAADAA